MLRISVSSTMIVLIRGHHKMRRAKFKHPLLVSHLATHRERHVRVSHEFLHRGAMVVEQLSASPYHATDVCKLKLYMTRRRRQLALVCWCVALKDMLAK